MSAPPPSGNQEPLIGSLNAEQSKEIFRKILEEYNKTHFTFRNAFIEAFTKGPENERVSDYKYFLIETKEFARTDTAVRYMREFHLTTDEVMAIRCYTMEAQGHNERSPYNILNTSLAATRNNSTLQRIGKFLFFLLSGLRKLKRFEAAEGQFFYRGISRQVYLSELEANGHQVYAKGEIITLWGFTSSSTNSEAAMNFTGNRTGTLFRIQGKPCGYQLGDLSEYPREAEILLEPETKLKVISVTNNGDLTIINAEFQPFKLVLNEIIPVKGIKQDKPVQVKDRSLLKSTWKSCPDSVDSSRKYTIKSPKVALKINENGFSTLIGCTHLSLNKVTSWNIKVLNSKEENGSGIYIGIAPFDINQNEDNLERCGWYFSCLNSSLWSGPPHNYRGKVYGLRKSDGNYIESESVVGVVMDTTRGELSFMLNGLNYGVAYGGIPLDEPLVPCVILYRVYDSVELNISEVKENAVNSSIPVPSNITATGISCSSITLTWERPFRADFYQIEVDGKKSFISTASDRETITGFDAETEHTFRVRTIYDNIMSKWSEVVKGKTLKYPMPSNIAIKMVGADFITIGWDPVEEVTEYRVRRIGANDSDRVEISPSNEYTIEGLAEDSEYSFTICAVGGGSIGESSDVITVRTLCNLSGWKECPSGVGDNRKYLLNRSNHKVVTKKGGLEYCAATGNSFLPLIRRSEWRVKILNSKYNNGKGIFIGVAPHDIDQDNRENYIKNGWYLNCFSFALYSGPTHNYRRKEYGPKKDKGKYVQTGSTVGVVMNTPKGELSFKLGGVNLGVAYGRIPLDKPLVPCVLLYFADDSVELVI